MTYVILLLVTVTLAGKILVPKNMSKSLSLIEARCRVLLWYVRILLVQSAGTESRSHGVRLETGGLTASELVQRKQIKVISSAFNTQPSNLDAKGQIGVFRVEEHEHFALTS